MLMQHSNCEHNIDSKHDGAEDNIPCTNTFWISMFSFSSVMPPRQEVANVGDVGGKVSD